MKRSIRADLRRIQSEKRIARNAKKPLSVLPAPKNLRGVFSNPPNTVVHVGGKMFCYWRSGETLSKTYALKKGLLNPDAPYFVLSELSPDAEITLPVAVVTLGGKKVLEWDRAKRIWKKPGSF